MFKGTLALGLATTVALIFSADVSTAKTTRSYEECHAIAVSRGVRPGKRPDYYLARAGAGQKTKPQGLIARCMAGNPI